MDGGDFKAEMGKPVFKGGVLRPIIRPRGQALSKEHGVQIFEGLEFWKGEQSAPEALRGPGLQKKRPVTIEGQQKEPPAQGAILARAGRWALRHRVRAEAFAARLHGAAGAIGLAPA
jgi:hypothetical protein